MTDPMLPGMMPPGPSIAEALRPLVEQSLAKGATALVHEAVKAKLTSHITPSLEAVELLADFESDVKRGLDELVTREASEDAIETAISDILFPPEPELYFSNLGEFVEQYVARVYRRDVQGTTHLWCARWFEHEPVVVALQVLWTAFETYRRDPGVGPLVFHRDGLLPIMNAVTHPDGPLHGCDARKNVHNPLPPLPCAPIPPGLFEPTPGELQGMPTAPPDRTSTDERTA